MKSKDQTWTKVSDVGEYDLYEAPDGQRAYIRWEGGRPIVVKAFSPRGREIYEEDRDR